MLDAVRIKKSREVDCADCVSRGRCWSVPVSPGNGFLVQRVRPLAAGDHLYRQDEASEAPYLITSGCIALTEVTAAGSIRIAAFRVAGELVGLESLHDGPRRQSAQAVGTVTACRLRWSRAGIAARPPPVLRTLLAKCNAQLEQASAVWPGLPATERVKAFLADLYTRSGRPLPMTRIQIGQHLGLAEETVVRAIATLRARRELPEPESRLDQPEQKARGEHEQGRERRG
jgi:CRP/FNR family transcriptional regulator